MKTRLLIARHGNTFGPNEPARRVGTTDLPLVESGLQQARALGYYLKQHHLIPDLIFTSELRRVIQTAQEIQNVMTCVLPTQALSIFNEIDYGPDENQTEETVRLRIGETAIQNWEKQAVVPMGWKVNPEEVIENWKVFANQFIQQHVGKTGLVITSNGIARFSPYLTGDFVNFSSTHGIKIATGALCIFEHQNPDTVWNCIEWNKRP